MDDDQNISGRGRGRGRGELFEYLAQKAEAEKKQRQSGHNAEETPSPIAPTLGRGVTPETNTESPMARKVVPTSRAELFNFLKARHMASTKKKQTPPPKPSESTISKESSTETNIREGSSAIRSPGATLSSRQLDETIASSLSREGNSGVQSLSTSSTRQDLNKDYKSEDLSERPRSKVTLDEDVSQKLNDEDSKASPVSSEKEEADVANVTKSMQNLSTTDETNLYCPEERRGNVGTEVELQCNYIRIDVEENKGVFEYVVEFEPNVPDINKRMKILNKNSDVFGGIKMYDGAHLYVPSQLPEKIIKVYDEEFQTEMSLTFTRKKPAKDCSHFYNVLFDRVMKTLKYIRYNRKQFDPTDPKIIPQAKLEIWPGYVTSVDEYDGGLMLCCDVSHRILCQKTVLEDLKEIYASDPVNFKTNACKGLLGNVAITRYNNKTYRIDDINFAMNPQSTFSMSDGTKLTFEQYYKEYYHLNIKDLKQPLLSSIQRVKAANTNAEDEERIIYLVPELSYLTGLRDHQRADFRLMQEVSSYTRTTPAQRALGLSKLRKNISECVEAKKILSDWGLTLCSENKVFTGRRLPEETIIMNNKQISAGPNADFTRFATNNNVLEAVPLQKWCIVYHGRNSSEAQTFLNIMERNCGILGIQLNKPTQIKIKDDSLKGYVGSIRERPMKEMQMIVVIVPNIREDRYNAIKKVCSAELGIASQVIHAKTLSKESKNCSIVAKIALQINCKLGGSLWRVNIPFRNAMICGIDVYHDPSSRNKSVAAFVASLNKTFTRWFSKASMQNTRQEISLGLEKNFLDALKEYLNANDQLPDHIIIYRDGVGDSQLETCLKLEMSQFETCARDLFDNYEPKFTFIVVQKRINTRYFNMTKDGLVNPLPGTIADSDVTRRNLYDFFLVSQSVRQGTVTPSHYIVLRDDSKFKPHILQRLSYKLTFMYYNYSGTLRIPACCQYAHKLAYLVGQNMKGNAAEKLNTVLYYL